MQDTKKYPQLCGGNRLDWTYIYLIKCPLSAMLADNGH